MLPEMNFQIKKQQQKYPELLLQFPSVEQRFLRETFSFPYLQSLLLRLQLFLWSILSNLSCGQHEAVPGYLS